MNTVRATLLLPPALLRRLKLFAHQHETTMSAVVTEGVRRLIEEHEPDHVERLYEGLFALRGTGHPGVTDASATIDEALYGDDGAWKGIRE